jgi:hypothetical protein
MALVFFSANWAEAEVERKATNNTSGNSRFMRSICDKSNMVTEINQISSKQDLIE